MRRSARPLMKCAAIPENSPAGGNVLDSRQSRFHTKAVSVRFLCLPSGAYRILCLYPAGAPVSPHLRFQFSFFVPTEAQPWLLRVSELRTKRAGKVGSREAIRQVAGWGRPGFQ